MSGEWGEEIRFILQTAEKADETLRAVSQWLGRNVVATDCISAEMPEPIGTLVKDAFRQLADINGAANAAFDRYCSVPVSKFMRGHPLTREEYYLLAAMQILRRANRLAACPMDDYEVFQMLRYEDSEESCYINPDEPPREARDTRVRIRIGKPPEDLRLSALRPEQREFFERYDPATYVRFKRD